MKGRGVFIVLILVGFTLYFNSLTNSFHYDDNHHIVSNPYIRTVSNIPLFFTEPRTFSASYAYHTHYRPLILVSYAINYYFGKLDPRGYHIVNLGFHVGSAFLVSLILQAMLTPPLPSPIPPPIRGVGQGTPDSPQGGGGKRWGEHEGLPYRKLFIPLAAGLLFLTTPYNTEVVNYIAARSTVMCGFFYLLAFWCWVKYRQAAGSSEQVANSGSSKQVAGSRIEERVKRQEAGNSVIDFPAACCPLPAAYFYIASLLAFLLAMLTKEVAITLPVMLVLYDVYFTGSVRLYARIRYYLAYLPFAVVGGFIGVFLRMVFFGSFITEKETRPLNHLLVEIKVIARYFFHMAIPINLSVEHPIKEISDIYFILSLVLIISLVTVACLFRRSRDPLWRTGSFFIAWFFIVLLPTTFIALVAPYQENRGYLSAIGFVALVAVGLEKVRKRIVSGEMRHSLLGYSIVGLIVVVYSIGVAQRNRVWLNDGTLWSDVLKKYPQSINAHKALGDYYMNQRQLDLADVEYLAVLKGNPEDLHVLTNLGVIYLEKGEKEKGEEFFKKALNINPLADVANFHMANLLQAQGDLLQAAQHMIRVLEVKTDDLDAAVRLIYLYERMGRLEEAYDHVLSAKEEDTENPAVRRALGLIYMKRSQWMDAAREYEMVLRYIPDNPPTLIDLGIVYFKQGLTYHKTEEDDDALRMYRKALEVDPKSFNALNNIGLIYFDRKEYEEAVTALQMALYIAPSNHRVRINLARVYENQGRIDLAREEYQRVLREVSPEGKDKKIYIEAKERLATP